MTLLCHQGWGPLIWASILLSAHAKLGPRGESVCVCACVMTLLVQSLVLASSSPGWIRTLGVQLSV